MKFNCSSENTTVICDIHSLLMLNFLRISTQLYSNKTTKLNNQNQELFKSFRAIDSVILHVFAAATSHPPAKLIFISLLNYVRLILTPRASSIYVIVLALPTELTHLFLV